MRDPRLLSCEPSVPMPVRPTPPTSPATLRSRVLAVGGAAAIAIVLVVVALALRGGPDYEVTVELQDAAQLIEGDRVVIDGNDVGKVTSLDITRDGLASVRVSVAEPWAPLREGTKAIVRLPSQSGINRYVQLLLPDDASQRTLADGAVLSTDKTTTAVDFDQIFNLFDKRTRRATQRFFRRGHDQLRGVAGQQAEAYRFLNPGLATSSLVFDQLNRDEPTLERFLVDSARLVTTLAGRKEDLTTSVSDLNTTFEALSRDQGALQDAITRLPPVLEKTNRVLAEARDVIKAYDPVIDASRPLPTVLKPWLRALTPLVQQSGPVLDQLARTNDGIASLAASYPALKKAALDPVQRNGKERLGGFPETARALQDSIDLTAFLREYTPDIAGWFNDYGNAYFYDALGAVARSSIVVNAFSANSPTPTPLPLSQRAADLTANAKVGQYKRCPGGADVPYRDGSNVFTEAEQKALGCRESDRAVR